MNIIFKGFIFAILFTAFSILFNALFWHDHRSVLFYVVQGVLSMIMYSIVIYLDEKGWNSWKKIGNLFKKNK